MDIKRFRIGAVLCVTTGRMLTKMEDVYKIMGHILGSSDVTTITLATMAKPCEQFLLQQFPDLEQVDLDSLDAALAKASGDRDKEIAIEKWLVEQSNIFGIDFDVPEMDPMLVQKLQANYEDRLEALFDGSMEEFDAANPIAGPGENPLNGAL